MKPSLKLLCTFVVLSISALMLACGGGINTPIVTGSITKTANPLVAQYTVTSGCVGQAMVEFGPDTSYGRSTNWVPLPGRYQSTDILVAGMRASSAYHMRSDVQCSGSSETMMSADTVFTTGPLPQSVTFPPMTVSRPSPSSSSPENPGIELVDIIAPTQKPVQAYFIDRDGNPIWYYDVGQNNFPFPLRPMPSGHIIMNVDSNTSGDTILREVDLAGNTIREMDISVLAQKTKSGGYDFVPTDYHHEILPLDNGHVIVLVNTLKSFTDLPGYSGTTQVLGDALIDLDANWDPVWAWNGFDHLDVKRHLNGLPDWTHSNALVYLPEDGNLLMSMRHQSWILKIDYSNGTGTGNILWKLGYQGDFTLTQNGVMTTDPSQWFSFQHFPSLISQDGSQILLNVWDNGDNRVLDTSGAVCAPPSTPCYSRATKFRIDESSMTADLEWDDLPGYYSIWGGSINQLENGNVEFDINSPFTANPIASEIREITQTSTPQTVWQLDFGLPYTAYRAYRVPSLYPGITWKY